MRLWDELKAAMCEHPDSLVSEGTRRYTFAEFIEKVEGLADTLHAECYAIDCQSELNAALALLACLAAGKTAVPLSHRYGEIHNKRILNFVQPPFILSDVDEGVHAQISGYDGYKMPENPPALIMCTSGTTGHPKGVMLSEESLRCNLSDIRVYFQIRSDDRIFITRPLYHCAVLTGEFLVSLLVGCDIVFYSGSFNPAIMLRCLDEAKVTVWGNTPTLWKSICTLAHVMKMPIHLRVLMVSGEVLPKTIAELLRRTFPTADIYHVYGLTEASPRVASLPPDEFDSFSDTVGYPLRSVTCRIVDARGRVVGPGEIGELIVRGDNVMNGYYLDDQATQNALIDGWLHTGDMASVDGRGYIKIHGRKDSMIIRAGMNIYPAEIEQALRADERVKDLYVYGKPDPMFGETIVLVISGAFADEKEVRQMCINKLSSYEQPSQIILQDELRYTASGKLIRSKE